MNALTALLARHDLTPIYPARAATKQPVTDHDRDPDDITDIWTEAGFSDEAEAFAYFDMNASHGQYSPTLIGLRIEEDGLTTFYDAGGAIDQLGLEAVMRLERWKSDEVNG